MRLIADLRCYILFLFVSLALSLQVIAGNHNGSNDTTCNRVANDYLKALLRFEPWAESVWKDYPAIPDAGYFGDGASGGNGGIRGNAGITVCYMVLIRAFPDAPQRTHRLNRVDAALRYAVRTHQSGPSGIVAVDGEKWGVAENISLSDRRGWQTSMWAAFMGLAAALLEKELDPELIKECKRVVAAEATWRAKIAPPSRYKLNSAGEETGWQSNVLALAASWMPEDTRAGEWMEAAKIYLANTYSVPKDSAGPLKKWISTQTLFPSYAMENHGFYHPAYQKDGGQSLGDSYLMARLVNPKVSAELQPFAEHNVMEVWSFLKGVFLESGDLAYASGMDWTLHQFEHVPYLAWIATHFNQPEAQWLEHIVAKQILQRQQVNGDGRFIGESCTDCFYVEALQSLSTSMAYLHNELAGFPEKKGAPLKNHITHYADVGLIVQRTDKSVTTVSYGSKTMALVIPRNGKTIGQQFMISPNTASLIGTEGKTVLNDFKETRSGFRASFTLRDDKNNRHSVVTIESGSNYTAVIEIPTGNEVKHPKEWYLMAIENHPMTGGLRNVHSLNRSLAVKERSGMHIPPVTTGWMNVDNWLGVIVPSAGSIEYRTAKEYNRNGAAEDALIFVPENNEQPHAIIILPGVSSEFTSDVHKSTRVVQTEHEFRIIFKPPGKAIVEISKQY